MTSDPLGSAEQARQLVEELRAGAAGHAPNSIHSLLLDGSHALEASLAREEALREALEVYADPRHWGISRDDFDHRVVAWIGPGATKPGMPDAMAVARVALHPAAEGERDE